MTKRTVQRRQTVGPEPPRSLPSTRGGQALNHKSPAFVAVQQSARDSAGIRKMRRTQGEVGRGAWGQDSRFQRAVALTRSRWPCPHSFPLHPLGSLSSPRSSPRFAAKSMWGRAAEGSQRLVRLGPSPSPVDSRGPGSLLAAQAIAIEAAAKAARMPSASAAKEGVDGGPETMGTSASATLEALKDYVPDETALLHAGVQHPLLSKAMSRDAVHQSPRMAATGPSLPRPAVVGGAGDDFEVCAASLGDMLNDPRNEDGDDAFQDDEERAIADAWAGPRPGATGPDRGEERPLPGWLGESPFRGSTPTVRSRRTVSGSGPSRGSAPPSNAEPAQEEMSEELKAMFQRRKNGLSITPSRVESLRRGRG